MLRSSRLLVGAVVLALVAIAMWLFVRERTRVPDPNEAAASIAEPTPQGRPQGRWREVRTPSADQTIADLEAIGYAGGSVDAPVASGVTVNDTEHAYEGLNFFTSGDAPGATLMDMQGNTLFTWAVSFEEAFPGRVVKGNPDGLYHWRRAYLMQNGDVLAIFGGLGLIRVDRDSNVLWSYDGLVHHDVDIRPNGDLFTLVRVVKKDPVPIAEDWIVQLDGNGQEKGRWSVQEAVAESEFSYIWDRNVQTKGDLFHTNAIRVIEPGVEKWNPEFIAGRVLLSMRQLNALAVVDLKTNRVVWAHRGNYLRQHDPRILDNGNLLLFDNQGLGRQSRVLEFKLADMSSVWGYRGSQSEPFYSNACGTSARLPNGDTMITESDGGRAFEVNRRGDIVWEYVNPLRAGEGGRFIAAIFEMQRLPLDWFDPSSPSPAK